MKEEKEEKDDISVESTEDEDKDDDILAIPGLSMLPFWLEAFVNPPLELMTDRERYIRRIVMSEFEERIMSTWMRAKQKGVGDDKLVITALTLLGPLFKDCTSIRSAAVKCLQTFDDRIIETLLPFVPQIVQILRCDPTQEFNDDMSLLLKLLENASRQSSQFLLSLRFMILAEEPEMLSVAQKVTLQALENIASENEVIQASLNQQCFMWGQGGVMQKLTEKLRKNDGDTKEDEVKKIKYRRDRDENQHCKRSSLSAYKDLREANFVFRDESEKTNPPDYLSLRALPSFTSLNEEKRKVSSPLCPDTSWKASLLTSQDRPELDLVSGSRVRVMYKEGDDLRQDVVVLQFLRLMDKLWKDADLDLPMVIYRVQPTAFRKGVIEMVPNCMTWQDILDKFGNDDRAPIRYLQSHNPTTRMYVFIFLFRNIALYHSLSLCFSFTHLLS